MTGLIAVFVDSYRLVSYILIHLGVFGLNRLIWVDVLYGSAERAARVLRGSFLMLCPVFVDGYGNVSG